MNFLDKYQEETYALLRIISGFLFIWHGTQKLFNFSRRLSLSTQSANVRSRHH